MSELANAEPTIRRERTCHPIGGARGFGAQRVGRRAEAQCGPSTRRLETHADLDLRQEAVSVHRAEACDGSSNPLKFGGSARTFALKQFGNPLLIGA